MQFDNHSLDLGRLAHVGLADGPFTRYDALRASVSRHLLDRWVKEGIVRVPLRGAYLSSALTDTVELRARCLAKVVAPHVVIVDRTAAWLWGVDTYALAELKFPLPIDAFSLRGGSRVRRGGVRGGTRSLSVDDWTWVEGVRVCTPLRTALDLACSLSRYEAVAALDALLRAQGMSQESLLQQLPRFRGRRGVIQAREVVRLLDPRAESPGESVTRVVIVEEGLPSPELQVSVFDERGNPVYRLDHAYEELKIGIEYDGEEHHTSAEDRRHDAERRAWLRAHGWIIIVVTKSDFAVHKRSEWIDAIRSARCERLEERRALRARPLQRADRVTREQLGLRSA
ncbi:DUF559 domain-containing protein [Nocardioides sp. HDW12B]|uniref:type IV toxin-antitoxin system AbiEi family antitoxin n=1 Tax=Nocardioides sp. HDW12B TaxID=2714939 RepID=UPI001409665E|nr:DUF559 domain-containing protein [Nocardioides sp. HDW12B]QIK66048.1 DUF559 domain-containing protein [Nocardioides sp. HDW12B]